MRSANFSSSQHDPLEDVYYVAYIMESNLSIEGKSLLSYFIQKTSYTTVHILIIIKWGFGSRHHVAKVIANGNSIIFTADKINSTQCYLLCTKRTTSLLFYFFFLLIIILCLLLCCIKHRTAACILHFITPLGTMNNIHLPGM